jgi:hypothetical protein
MPFTTYWFPNQAAIAQVETYTFSAPSGIGNTYTATINGKSVTYISVSGDTAASAATALFNLLNVSTSIAAELTEITFANPSDGVLTATARVAGTPFANVSGGTSAGLVLSTGNGLANGITTVHTTSNASPSDVVDPQNWLRVNTGVTPPSKTRAIPVNGDNVVVNNSSVPMLWNLDQLATVQFATYTRHQSMIAQIGLPENNPGGYAEWRALDFKFVGPLGSVPAGGLSMILGFIDNLGGSGPTYESYDTGSQPVTITVLASGGPIRWRGLHTANTFVVLGGVQFEVATRPGEIANLTSSTLDGGALLGVGAGVTWTAGSTLTLNGGAATLGAAPATVAMLNGAQVVITTDQLTWASITGQNSCRLVFLAGGTITNYVVTTGCVLDKSLDGRALTITTSTIDGDTCQIIDPLNAITYTNATTVKQAVNSGPFRFTGTKSVKVS